MEDFARKTSKYEQRFSRLLRKQEKKLEHIRDLEEQSENQNMRDWARMHLQPGEAGNSPMGSRIRIDFWRLDKRDISMFYVLCFYSVLATMSYRKKPGGEIIYNYESQRDAVFS